MPGFVQTGKRPAGEPWHELQAGQAAAQVQAGLDSLPGLCAVRADIQAGATIPAPDVQCIGKSRQAWIDNLIGIGRVASPAQAAVVAGIEGQISRTQPVNCQRQEAILPEEDRRLRQVLVGLVASRERQALLGPGNAAVVRAIQEDFPVHGDGARHPPGAEIAEGHAVLNARQGQAVG